MWRLFIPSANPRTLVLLGSLLTIVLTWQLSAPDTALAQSQGGLETKSVLILHSYETSLPIFVRTDGGLFPALQSGGIGSLNRFSEFLDLRRNPGPKQRKLLVDAMRVRYGHRKIDMIITMYPEALEFVLKDCRDILPDIPILALYLPKGIELPRTDRRIIRHFPAFDINGTIEIALKLVPGAKRVYVVNGVSEVSWGVEDQTRLISKKWEGQLEFLYLSRMPFKDILAAVSKAPPGSIILMLSFGRDVTGKYKTAPEAVLELSRVSAAPIFGIIDTVLGYGVVGGSLTNFEGLGARVGQLVLDILGGAQGIPAVLDAPSVPMFDWRQLRHWNLNDGGLPNGSIVINKEFTLWDFRYHIIGGLTFLIGQSFLIVFLVVQRGRRKRAEKAMSKTEGKYRHIFDNALEGIFETSLQGQVFTANPSMAKMLGYDSPAETISSIKDTASIVWVTPEQREDYIQLLEKQGVVRGFECRFLRRDGSAFWVSLSTRRIIGPEGQEPFYSGFVVDITERKLAEQLLEDRLKFERFLANTSAHFVNLPTERIDDEIEETQRLVCENLGLDRSALWQFLEEEPGVAVLKNIHQPPGIRLPSRPISSRDLFPWAAQKVLGGDTVVISKMTDLPPEAACDRESFDAYGTKSTVLVPFLMKGGEVFGAISFAVTREERIWSEEVVTGFKLIAQVFANALIRKHADEALRESEERLSLATNAADAGLWIIEINTGHIWATAKTRELFQIAPDQELNYARFVDMIYPEDRENVKQDMEQGRQSGDIFLTEYRIVQPDGSIRWMLARGRCYLKQTGEADRFIGVSIDITSRKRAEAALNDSMERFQQVAENVADFIWEVDAKGLYNYTSPAVEKILGYSPGELDGKMHFYDLFAPEVREELKGAAFQVIARKDAFRKFPNPNIRKDGEVVHLETSGVPILDGEGNLVGYRGADSDVTERWMAEQQIAMQRNQLLHLSRVSTMGQLASSLAHELNQPLGAILRNAEAAELLLEDPLPDLDEVRAILADICKDDHRAGDVINRMRGLLKRGKLERRSLDIERLVEEIATLMRPDIDFHEVKLDSQIDGSVLPSVYGDPVQLQQVLLNLLANAVEALKQNPRESRLVTVRARRVGITVEVAVSDTGPGIPEHELFRVFEPFFSSKSDGLGMGLAISRTIIEAHGGRLWAENKTTGGTTFTFALPVSKDSGPTMGGGGR